MSPAPEQRAQVLYLFHVEGVSVVLIAVMTGLSESTVRRMLRETSRQDVQVMEKAAAMRPSSQGRIERQLRKERRHDRT
jgi:DNA-binding transcriptional regulator LsrR (DeoR family)